MNKKLIAVAIAIIAAPAAGLAAPEIYGNVNLSVNKQSSVKEYRLTGNTSSIGVKGSEDLESGLKVLYKVEFEFEPTERGSNETAASSDSKFVLSDRDQWVGLSAEEYGTLRAGTISTSYKSSGADIDPLYRTPFEGRGFAMIQSSLHTGSGVNGGRSTNTIRYDSPELGGVTVIGTYSLGENVENTLGMGAHFRSGPIKAHVDFLDSGSANANAYKVGGQYDFGNGLLLGAQYEKGDVAMFNAGTAESVFMINGAYVLGNTAYVLAYGEQDGYSNGLIVALDHKLGKSTDIYAGYSRLEFDKSTGRNNDNLAAVGLRYNF